MLCHALGSQHLQRLHGLDQTLGPGFELAHALDISGGIPIRGRPLMRDAEGLNLRGVQRVQTS